jgi:hypothetical protein
VHGHTLYVCVYFMQISCTAIFIQQDVYWDAVSCSANQNVSYLLGIQIFGYRVHESQPLGLIPSHLNSVSTFTHCFQRVIVMLSSHLWTGLMDGLFSSDFLNRIIYNCFNLGVSRITYEDERFLTEYFQKTLNLSSTCSK